MKILFKYKLPHLLVSILALIVSLNNYAEYNKDNLNSSLISTSAASKTHETVLDNGLKVVVKEDHRAPVIISQVWYKVGSSYEPLGITGISHMLEHMMFKASKNLKDGEFVEIIAKNGGSQNAMTSSDFTAYYQLLASDRLEVSMQLEAERMQNLLLDKDVFAKEREVVIEERRMRTDDDPIRKVYERFSAVANMGSPYHHPVIGWPDDLRSYTTEDLRKWYDLWYSPNNATIVVVGDVKPKEVFTLAKKYFGDISGKKLPEIKYKSEVEPIGRRNLNIELEEAKLPHLYMAYNVPSINTAKDINDVYALDVISYILSGGNSARFPKILERKKELVTYASSSYDSFNIYNSLFSMRAIPASGKTIDDVHSAIGQQLETLKTELVSQDELERVKAALIASKVYEQDSIYYQALLIGILESINLSWRDYDDYIKRLQVVTPEQIKITAQKYFTDDRLTTAVLKPKKS